MSNSNPGSATPDNTTTRRRLGLLALCAGLLVGADAPAQPRAPEPPAVEQARAHAEQARELAEQARFAAEAQQQALAAAEREQSAALQAVESARRQLEQRALEHDAQLQAEQARAAQRELQQAHSSLRAASQEVARVHRELERQQVRSIKGPPRAPDPGQGRAVLGIILGARSDAGIEVLGVSPDGPAERAGVKPHDLIVSAMGTPLAAADGDALSVLGEALKGIEPDDEVDLGLLRDGRRLDVTVVAQQRTPFSWHAYSRISSAPDDGELEVQIERIVVPDIDREALDQELERVTRELERSRIGIDRVRGRPDQPAPPDRPAPPAGPQEQWIIELDDLSEFGDDVLGTAGIWMGMPLTRGLRMTSLEPALGEYFNTDSGVLVLAAREDNALQLRAGDVILEIAGRAVSSPVEVMRSLREHAGAGDIDIRIMRRQQPQELKVTVPEQEAGFGFLGLPPSANAR